MKDDMLPVCIKGVAMPSRKDLPVVLLGEENGLREFTLKIGASEAGAILMKLEGVSTPRPMTHELMAGIFKEQGINIYKVELYKLYGINDGSCLAKIEYGRGLKTFSRDIRPSDALALAINFGAPIFAHISLIEDSADNGYEALDFG